MRGFDWESFGKFNNADVREPRVVVAVLYDDGDLVITSHDEPDNLTLNVPTVVPGVIKSVSSISQTIEPIEGRSTIGGVTIEALDVAQPIAGKQSIRNFLQTRLNGGQSPHNLKVQVYVGFTDDFADYHLVHTSYLRELVTRDFVYTFKCDDAPKLLRREIFDLKSMRLAEDLDDVPGAAAVQIHEVIPDIRLQHTPSFQDQPANNVGYMRVKDTGEIISYLGQTSSPPTLVINARGRFGTGVRATEGDFSLEFEKWPELEEVIYLELPAPQLAYAIMTGVIPNSGSPEITLPSHWHLGFPEDRIDRASFENIGEDLWNPADWSQGLVLFFLGLTKEDGKRFLETEVYRLCGIFPVVNEQGLLSLRRVNRSITGSAYIAALNQSNISDYGTLDNRYSEVVNQYLIRYQWDGEKYLRSFLFVDSDSVTLHGPSDVKVLEFKGLHNSRHSLSLIAQIINTLQDRHRSPPIRADVSLLPEWNRLEAGDMVRLDLPPLLDYTWGFGWVFRAMEIQRTSINWVTGQVRLSLFGSTGEAGGPLYVPQVVLSDAFYTSVGTAMSSVLTISGNAVTANGTINGYVGMNDSNAVFYHDDDLTINAGVTVTITGNVQLRIRGTLTVNGTINGVGGGKAGAVDPHTIGATPHASFPLSVGYAAPGSIGYVGNTCATDGIERLRTGSSPAGDLLVGRRVEGLHQQFPNIIIGLDLTSLTGIPNDLQGTSGSSGGPVVERTGSSGSGGRTVRAKGGTGGASGAGLCIIARGAVLGANGIINLSGGNGVAGGVWNFTSPVVTNRDFAAGTGGGGSPGCMAILIDGPAALPVLGNKFIARTGQTVPQAGYRSGSSGPLSNADLANNAVSIFWNNAWGEPWAGHNEDWNAGTPANIIHNVNLSDSCFFIGYIPEPGG